MQWIDGCCLVVNLEVQFYGCGICVVYCSDFLFCFNVLFIINQYGVIMSVSCNVIFIVFNYDEIVVVVQLVFDIDNFICFCCINRCFVCVCNIDFFIFVFCGGIR